MSGSILAALPYAGLLGMTLEMDDDGPIARLPFAPALIGNTSLPALHGGVIAAFLELTAQAALIAAAPDRGRPTTIDMTVDYLRSGRPVLTHARAHVVKLGRRIANVRVEAWQDDEARPIAALRGHFRWAEARPAP